MGDNNQSTHVFTVATIKDLLEREEMSSKQWLAGELTRDPSIEMNILIEILFGQLKDKLNNPPSVTVSSGETSNNNMRNIPPLANVLYERIKVEFLTRLRSDSNYTFGSLVEEEGNCQCSKCLSGSQTDNSPYLEVLPNGQMFVNENDAQAFRAANKKPKKVRRPSIEDQLEPSARVLYFIQRFNCLNHDCSRMFIDEAKLMRHMQSVHYIRQYRCFVAPGQEPCTCSFKDRSKLERHLNRIHPASTKWTCRKCSVELASHDLLTKHTIEHHYRGRFVCSVDKCCFFASDRASVIEHYHSEHQDELMELDEQIEAHNNETSEMPHGEGSSRGLGSSEQPIEFIDRSEPEKTNEEEENDEDDEETE